jgi:uncharacterized protein
MQLVTSAPPYAEFVIKVSKFCNLRCKYCYEYPWLGDSSSMSLEDIETMFGHIAEYFAPRARRLEFVWHWGEPLLLGLDFYKRAIESQHRIFGGTGLEFTNMIQTNLTTVRPADMPELAKVFPEIGISVDLFGGNRVNSRGIDSQPKVLGLMQDLLDTGLPFGCITVLSQSTAPYVSKIYDFYEDIGVSFRLLPIYRTGFAGQLAPFELSDTEIVDAFKITADRWFASSSGIQVEPIETYIRNVLAHVQRIQPRHYDKEKSEAVFIIDTDGSVYSNGDTYDPKLSHGNVFRQSFESMRASPGFRLALEQSRQRVDEACTGCTFFGWCSGYFMGEATPEQRWHDEEGRLRCGVAKPIQTYIEDLLRRDGLLKADDLLDLDTLRVRAPSAIRSGL